MGGFKPAGQFEILRSVQKDDQIRSSLKLDATELAQRILGIRAWLKAKHQLEIAMDLVYYGLTTMGDLQSLGEEYVNIVQTDGTRRKLPTKWRRGTMVCIQAVAPTALDAILDRGEKWVASFLTDRSNPETAARLHSYFSTCKQALKLLYRMHITMFYIRGDHYHLSKRLAGVRYVLVRDWLKFTSMSYVFRILGILSALQLVVESVTLARMIFSTTNEQTADLKTAVTKSIVGDGLPNHQRQCMLCFDSGRQWTCTPCAHLFCWECISAWLQTDPRCPTCRETIHPSRLVYLQNFR